MSSSATGGSSSGTSTSGTTGGAQSQDAGPFTFLAADTSDAGMAGLPIAMAVGPSDQVGVAYFRPTGNSLGSAVDYGLMYFEVRNGAISVPPAQITVVQNQDGLTIDFDAQGNAVVGFLGGEGSSSYWLQSQAALAYQQSDGGWNLQVCMQDSTAMGAFTWTVDQNGSPDMSAMQLVNEGKVVGLWPALVFDGGTALMAYRDVHFGESPIQDWAASDVKLCQGTPGNWTSWSAPMTVDASGADKPGGYGLHNQLIFGPNGALAALCDSDSTGQGAVDAQGTNVWFAQQNLGSWTNSTSDWSLPVNPLNPTNNAADVLVDTQSGPTMAYNATFGYSVAAVDTSPPGGGPAALYYASSPDGQTWSTRQTVFSLGSGGFYPSLADDPVSGDPNLVYTVCSGDPGVTPAPGACDAPELHLVVVGTNPPNWAATTTTVTTQAAFTPKIAFLSTDKVVIAYRDLDTGSIYLAFQR